MNVLGLSLSQVLRRQPGFHSSGHSTVVGYTNHARSSMQRASLQACSSCVYGLDHLGEMLLCLQPPAYGPHVSLALSPQPHIPRAPETFPQDPASTRLSSPQASDSDLTPPNFRFFSTNQNNPQASHLLGKCPFCRF